MPSWRPSCGLSQSVVRKSFAPFCDVHVFALSLSSPLSSYLRCRRKVVENNEKGPWIRRCFHSLFGAIRKNGGALNNDNNWRHAFVSFDHVWVVASTSFFFLPR